MGRVEFPSLVLSCGFESVVVLRGQMDRENMMSHDEIDRPAFPSIGPGKEWFPGMTKLEFMTAIIMSGLVANEDRDPSDAPYAVELAKAVLEATYGDLQKRMEADNEDFKND